MNRDQIRSQIFSAESRKGKSKIVIFHGAEVEIRQPVIGDIINQSEKDGATAQAMLKLIIKNTFVPNTDERVFEDADYDALVGMPLDESFNAIIDAITDITGVKVKEQEKN